MASVILQHQNFSLEWVLKKSKTLQKRSAPEFLGIESSEAGTIYAADNTGIEELLDKHPVDTIIDFSSEQGIYTYGEAAGKRNISIISAVSHYKEETLTFLKTLSKKTTVFWSANITLGINYLMFTAQMLKKIAPWVDIQITEEHFKQKESVSGTAVKMAEVLQVDRSEINSVRAGGIVGRHEVIFGFPYQTVRLIHESISREAFGNGVIFAAENLSGRPNGFYRFEDLLRPYFADLPG